MECCRRSQIVVLVVLRVMLALSWWRKFCLDVGIRAQAAQNGCLISKAPIVSYLRSVSSLNLISVFVSSNSYSHILIRLFFGFLIVIAFRLTMKSVLASVFSILRGSPLGNLGSNDQSVFTFCLLFNMTYDSHLFPFRYFETDAGPSLNDMSLQHTNASTPGRFSGHDNAYYTQSF
jgi:flagellar biosynthesis protein FlhB